MIKQVIDVEGYWKVVVIYNVDYHHFHVVENAFKELKVSKDNKVLKEIMEVMLSWEAKGVTYSSLERHVSIVLFNKHCSKIDYINTLVHEAEHVKQAMLRAYEVEDKDEPPAYTIGYLVMKMWEVWKELWD